MKLQSVNKAPSHIPEVLGSAPRRLSMGLPPKLPHNLYLFEAPKDLNACGVAGVLYFLSTFGVVRIFKGKRLPGIPKSLHQLNNYHRNKEVVRCIRLSFHKSNLKETDIKGTQLVFDAVSRKGPSAKFTEFMSTAIECNTLR